MLKTVAKKALGVLLYGKCLLWYAAALFLSLFLRRTAKYRDLWLVAERGADARDNGYHFFKYLRQKRPSINCVYAIKKASPDYGKVASLGRTVETGSFAHYLAFACSVAKISTHIMGYAPDDYRFTMLDRRFRIVRGKKIFLQHGIIKDDIAELHYPKVRLDLFVCSTVMEEESLAAYHYPDGVIKRLGLCRYDALLAPHETRRQILIMPTWRYYLRTLSDKDFQNSDYYKSFHGLMQDGTLRELLERYDYTLVLYLHYELQPFSHLFEVDDPRVIVRTLRDSDVQELLMSSSMLITDYSSVFFDFAYMNKPLLYWQFDRELFFSEQYGAGYFDFEKIGFGPVVFTKEDVVAAVEQELQNGMKTPDEYRKRRDMTFADFSADHCEATCEAVLDLLRKKRN